MGLQGRPPPARQVTYYLGLEKMLHTFGQSSLCNALRSHGGGSNLHLRPRPSVAYIIMGTEDDSAHLSELLHEIWHPHDIFYVHLNANTRPELMAQLRDSFPQHNIRFAAQVQVSPFASHPGKQAPAPHGSAVHGIPKQCSSTVWIPFPPMQPLPGWCSIPTPHDMRECGPIAGAQ